MNIRVMYNIVNAHDITDDEMDKWRQAKTLDYKHKLKCEKKRVCVKVYVFQVIE